MKISKYVLVLFLFVGVLFPVFFGSRVIFRGLSQTIDRREKQIIRPNERNEPFEVTNIQSDEKSIQFGKTFRQDGDWLNNLSISYINKTKKSIVSFSLNLFFPESTETGNILMYSIMCGTPMSRALKGDRSEVFSSGDTITLSVGPQEYKKLKDFIERRQSLESLSKVELRVGFVLFDDGTAWDGQYRIRDPKHPGRWIETPTQEEVNR